MPVDVKTIDESELFPEVEPLTVSSRCDGNLSGAEQAFTRFRNGSQVVELCKHHADMYEAVLCITGWTLEVDNRETINSKPSISASSL